MYATKNRLNQVFIVALHVLAELLETLLAAVLSTLAYSIGFACYEDNHRAVGRHTVGAMRGGSYARHRKARS